MAEASDYLESYYNSIDYKLFEFVQYQLSLTELKLKRQLDKGSADIIAIN
jgi:hypothetical protein